MEPVWSCDLSLVLSFFRLYTYSLAQSLVCSFVRSFVRPFLLSVGLSVSRSFVRSLVLSSVRSLFLSFVRSFVRSFFRSLVRWFGPSFGQSVGSRSFVPLFGRFIHFVYLTLDFLIKYCGCDDGINSGENLVFFSLFYTLCRM